MIVPSPLLVLVVDDPTKVPGPEVTEIEIVLESRSGTVEAVYALPYTSLSVSTKVVSTPATAELEPGPAIELCTIPKALEGRTPIVLGAVVD